MTEFVFIRHGETDYNRKWKYLGHTDVPLNNRGILQVKKLKIKMKNEKFEQVICSDLKRCIQTAELLGLNKLSNYSEKFREINFGIIEGLTYNEIKEKYPEVIYNWETNFLDYKIKDGESFKEVQDRLVNEINILKKRKHKKIAIITHGGCIRIIMSYFITGNPKNFYSFGIENATINRLCFGDKYVYIKSINER